MRSSSGLLRFLRGSNLHSRLDRWDEKWRKWGCSPSSMVLILRVLYKSRKTLFAWAACSVAQCLTLAGLRFWMTHRHVGF
jgi:hypothetical protein